jgi:hypothetical protein
MSLYRKIQSIKAQIVDTERLLEMVLDHPLMSEGMAERLSLLKQELESLPKESFEPRIQLLFSGNAVVGSQGIKSTFLSKTLTPFQEMVKTQVALLRFGKVGKRGQSKKGANTELYLTALPVGSFGVELSQLESNDLFDSMDVSKAMKDVMTLVINSATNDETFEASIEKTPKRNLTNLKKFLQEITYENSALKMESGELGIELPKEKIVEAFQRVSATIYEETELIISGIFRGLLLDSGKFEIQVEEGKRISGFISEEIEEDQLVEYNKTFLNSNCIIHLRVHKTKFKTGNEKTDYELLEIRPGK